MQRFMHIVLDPNQTRTGNADKTYYISLIGFRKQPLSVFFKVNRWIIILHSLFY